jgi:hypothetical protein
MKLLLDECIPRSFKRHLPGHDCHTVPEVGWAGKKNGELLSLAERSGFDCFLTIDRGIEYQQNLSGRTLAIILVKSNSSRNADLLHHVLEVLRVLDSIRRGELIRIG